MMKTFCLDSHKDWDDGVKLLLFATREAFHESLRIIPFELFFGHSVGSPFRKKMALCFMYKLTRACEIEQDNLKQIKVITKLPNSEQSYKGKVKTHNYINRQNQSTTGKL